MKTYLKVLKWTGIVLGAVVLLLVVAAAAVSYFADEPLRKLMEERMNASLKGYTVTVGDADVSVWGLSVVLNDLTVRQQKNPEPPVADIKRMAASVQWGALAHARLVGDVEINRPHVHINLIQLRSEVKEKVPVRKRGWQGAVEAIYPLKINLLEITDGDITYIDKDPEKPLHIGDFEFAANNIRNVRQLKEYPSPIRMDGVVFESGKASFDGRADFLEDPFPGLTGKFTLKDVPIERFQPVLERRNIAVSGGKVSAEGEMEYAPGRKTLHVKDITVDGAKIYYVHSTATARREAARAEKIKRAAKEVAGKKEVELVLDGLTIKDSEFGFVNKAAEPSYTAFLTDTDLTVRNLSNSFEKGPAQISLTGKFMGSGRTKATASFAPAKAGPDLDLDLAVEGTQMTDMNRILLAYGDFDVVRGVFNLYMELHIKDKEVRGYVKPMFVDMKVFDKRQDRDKAFFNRLYQRFVGRVGKFLENPERGQVATRADISGRLDDPKTSTWQVVVNLVRNAFFQAFLPGFEEGLEKDRG